MNRAVWRGLRVFLTGHTGFKGGWLAVWLERLGAVVTGYSLAPTPDSFYRTARLAGRYAETFADIRDLDAVRRAVETCDPHVIFYMAAQPPVRASFADPIGTFSTNVMGTAHVLEAARERANLAAVVVITTDKVYRKTEVPHGHTEDDALGGHDPYSASKACAEHVCDAYRASFFGAGAHCLIASVRAGNVIGGGDWAVDRLGPDLVRAVRSGARARIRAPRSIRPWQHVLEPLSGYLRVAERLLEGDRGVAEAWNFGPTPDSHYPVSAVADLIVQQWGAGARWDDDSAAHPPETIAPILNPTKAKKRLGWTPHLELEAAVRLTVDWYRAAEAGGDALAVTLAQIRHYESLLAASRLSAARRGN